VGATLSGLEEDWSVVARSAEAAPVPAASDRGYSRTATRRSGGWDRRAILERVRARREESQPQDEGQGERDADAEQADDEDMAAAVAAALADGEEDEDAEPDDVPGQDEPIVHEAEE